MSKISVALLAALCAMFSAAGPAFAAGSAEEAASPDPLRIGYSDWPGWVAWEIGIQKGWFEEAGVAVEFEWFEYVPSLDAFAAGQIDAVAVTNGDALVNASVGAPGIMILVNDYSNGNDMVVARPGIDSIEELVGGRVGVEVGFVAHVLFLKAIEGAGLSQDQFEVINVATHQTPEVLATGEVDAIAAWQPNSGQALRALAGSTAIFTSADVPGLIYDTLTVNPASLAARRDDWKAVVAVWYRIADYIKDEANRDEVLEIRSARVNLSPEEYAPFLEGTYLLSLEEAIAAVGEGEGLGTLYGSSLEADAFNVQYEVYPEPLNVADFIDAGLMRELYEESR